MTLPPLHLLPSGTKRIREVTNANELEDFCAVYVNTYNNRLRETLVRGNDLNAEEIDPLLASVKRCAHEILYQWWKPDVTEDRILTSPHVTEHDIYAACTLARKAILGHDADITYRDDVKYNTWIIEFLAHHHVPCVSEQRCADELPTRLPSREEEAAASLCSLAQTVQRR